MTTLAPTTRREQVLASGYIMVVALTLTFVVGTHLVLEGDGTANLSGVWLFVVTLPWSLAVVGVSRPGSDVPFVVVGSAWRSLPG